MKKTIALLTMFSMVFIAMPAMAGTNTKAVNTSFERQITNGNSPIIKVKWEMYAGTSGDDTFRRRAGAQFSPTGVFNVNTDITVCAVVTDPDGVSDIDAVYADIYYPTNVALGSDHPANRQGCGQQHGNEFTLRKLPKLEGIDLLCNNIRQSNNNLPTWNRGYNYDEICAETGELWKQTAYVYCGNHTLSYEDPSGDYRTLVMAQDKYGLDSTLENHFKYTALTAFQTDFSSIKYGSVKLNTHKIINGDLTWEPDSGENLATVRNVGNTRLIMRVMQDDMKMGKTDNQYNVRWDARVGSDAKFRKYWPFQKMNLLNILNLSEMNEMDFSIEIFKFPPKMSKDFQGTMTLSAVKAAHLTCETPCTSGCGNSN